MEVMAVLYRAAGIEIVWPELPVLVSHRDRVFHGIAAALPKSAADAVASPQLLRTQSKRGTFMTLRQVDFLASSEIGVICRNAFARIHEPFLARPVDDQGLRG